MKRPTFLRERTLERAGFITIGVDEVGCGCLAGPVVAAAVHLPFSVRISLIRDSKLLAAKQREAIFRTFLEKKLAFGIGMATVQEVEALNVRRASVLAMRRATEACAAVWSNREKFFVLTDAWNIPSLRWPQENVIHGDRLVKTIAAASIIAKVVRDYMMKEFDREFPGYQFGRHKGYGTALHQFLLKKLGPSPLHRRTFLKNLRITA